jgi:hypothetical protein
MSKPLVTQLVERARALLSDRGGWIQNTIARKGNNRECDPTDAGARRFCAYGAILRAAHDLARDFDQAQRLADRAAMFIVDEDTPFHAFEQMIAINDGASSRKEVLALFDKALERA